MSSLIRRIKHCVRLEVGVPCFLKHVSWSVLTSLHTKTSGAIVNFFFVDIRHWSSKSLPNVFGLVDLKIETARVGISEHRDRPATNDSRIKKYYFFDPCTKRIRNDRKIASWISEPKLWSGENNQYKNLHYFLDLWTICKGHPAIDRKVAHCREVNYNVSGGDQCRFIYTLVRLPNAGSSAIKPAGSLDSRATRLTMETRGLRGDPLSSWALMSCCVARVRLRKLPSGDLGAIHRGQSEADLQKAVCDIWVEKGDIASWKKTGWEGS